MALVDQYYIVILCRVHGTGLAYILFVGKGVAALVGLGLFVGAYRRRRPATGSRRDRGVVLLQRSETAT